MYTTKVFNDDGSVEIYFEELKHWTEFDFLLDLIEKENDCKVISNKEMIYIRKAELVHNGIEFDLMHDDMLGNYILAKNDSDGEILKKLADNVIESIKNKLRKLDL